MVYYNKENKWRFFKMKEYNYYEKVREAVRDYLKELYEEYNN